MLLRMSWSSRPALNPSRQQAAADRVSAYTEFGPDVLVGAASVVLGNDVVHIKPFMRLGFPIAWRLPKVQAKRCIAFLMVAGDVLRLAHQCKVFDSVVRSITVSVMNAFLPQKRAAQCFLHDVPMFIDVAAVDADDSVAGRSNVSAFITMVIGAARSRHTHIVASPAATCQEGVATC